MCKVEVSADDWHETKTEMVKFSDEVGLKKRRVLHEKVAIKPIVSVDGIKEGTILAVRGVRDPRWSDSVVLDVSD